MNERAVKTGGALLTTSTLIWQNLGPRGDYQTPDSGVAGTEVPKTNSASFEVTQEGIRSWDAFLQFLKQAIEHAPKAITTLEFQLEVWAMDALTPPNGFQASLGQILSTRKLHINLLLANATHIVPQIWHWSAKDAAFLKVTDVAPDQFWHSEDATEFLKDSIDAQPLSAHLYRALQELSKNQARNQESQKNQKLQHSDWLEQLKIISAYQNPEHDYPTTRLWRLLQDINSEFLNAAIQSHTLTQCHKQSTSEQQNTNQPTLAALAHNPLSALILSQESKPSLGGVYSIGAGQMVSILDYTRQLIEDGLLPANTPLLADNRAFSAVVELQCTGQRRALLNHLWVNPKDRKPIAVHNEQLRLELIQLYQPSVIFLNVKAQALTSILSDNFCQSLAALPYTPVLVMPSKSYTNAGITPYEALHAKLQRYSLELAQNLTVLGGFYAAPSILTGDLVHLTIASESIAATHTVCTYLCPLSPPTLGTTVQHDSLKLELLEGTEAAAMLMSGGANKNFLTYYAARRILRQAFQADHRAPQDWLEGINQNITRFRQFNIRTSYDIAMKLVHHEIPVHQLNIATDDDPSGHKTPAGLATDFIYCLPLTGQGISSLVEQSYRLQKHLLRTPSDQRVTVAQQELHTFVEHVRKDPQRVYGTRNARDGLIDELLQYFFYAWQEHKQRIPLTLDAAGFYQAFYPAQWKGSSAQEGRNGILPVIVRASVLADLQHTQWPQAVLDAWQDYFEVPRATTSNSKNTMATTTTQSVNQFEHWHMQLVHLLNWAMHQGDAYAHLAAQRLKEWCQTTRALSLQEVPRMLYQLEQGLVQVEQDQMTLLDLCQRIRRDCQYRERQ